MAQTGDWVAAFGAAMTPYKGKLVMLMQVEEAMSLMSIGWMKGSDVNVRYFLKD